MNGQANPPLVSTQRRPAALIFLHWLTLVLIALVVGSIFAREGFDEKAVRTLLMNLHRSVGLVVALLAVLRIVVRLAVSPLPPTAPMSPLARLAAGGAHLALYALLLALPLIGWALSSANGKPVGLFGLVTLPPIVAEDEDLADALEALHEGAAWLMLGLVGVHAAAALFHHVVKRDNVLRAMLPAWLGGRA